MWSSSCIDNAVQVIISKGLIRRPVVTLLAIKADILNDIPWIISRELYTLIKCITNSGYQALFSPGPFLRFFEQAWEWG